MSKMTLIAEPGKQEITLKRTFSAPREMVFKAVTDPDLIPNWWGPRRFTTTIEKMDVRHGGSWHFSQRDVDGSAYEFRGVYHLIVPNEQVVQTFEFLGAPGHISLETMTLVDAGGQTQMIATSVFQSVEARDAMLGTDMADGAAETYDRLDEVLRELAVAVNS